MGKIIHIFALAVTILTISAGQAQALTGTYVYNTEDGMGNPVTRTFAADGTESINHMQLSNRYYDAYTQSDGDILELKNGGESVSYIVYGNDRFAPGYELNSRQHKIDYDNVPCSYFLVNREELAIQDTDGGIPCWQAISQARAFAKVVLTSNDTFRKGVKRRIGNWQCLANTNSHFYCDNVVTDDEIDVVTTTDAQFEAFKAVRDRGFYNCGRYHSYNTMQTVWASMPDQCADGSIVANGFNKQRATLSRMHTMKFSPAYGCRALFSQTYYDGGFGFIHHCSQGFIVSSGEVAGYPTRIVRLVDGSVWIIPQWAGAPLPI